LFLMYVYQGAEEMWTYTAVSSAFTSRPNHLLSTNKAYVFSFACFSLCKIISVSATK
jgi:hypothetical protein